MKSFKEYTQLAESVSLAEESDYEQGMTHNVTIHRGNQDHAVGKHLNKHHPDEDHAGYIHIHTSKDGRHKYHAQVHSGYTMMVLTHTLTTFTMIHELAKFKTSRPEINGVTIRMLKIHSMRATRRLRILQSMWRSIPGTRWIQNQLKKFIITMK